MTNRVCQVSRLALIALLLAGVALGAVACGGDTGSGSGTQVATYLHIREPLQDWDPAVESADGTIVLSNVYETLLRYDATSNEFTPILATSYDSSKDGKTWTFKIREGVKFHDGTALNAAAVKFSVDRYIKLGTGLTYIWGPVKSVETPDDYTVVFNLKYPAPMDLVVSSAFAAFIVSPTAVESHSAKWLTEGHEAGTGPYMLQSWKMGQEVVLTKYPDYWGGWSGNHFDKAVIRKVPEAATKRQMIAAGDADIVDELPFEDYASLRADANLVVDSGPVFKNLQVMLNTKKAPLDDARVRQALSYLFPYGDAIKYAAGGYASQAKGVVPAGMWGHSEDVMQYTYDPAKAKELLNAAGVGQEGFTLDAVYTAGEEIQRKCLELYKAELAKVDITLDIRSGPWSAIWEQARQPNPKQDMYVEYWWPTYVDPYDFLYNLLHSSKEPQYNLSYWKNAEFDQLIDQASQVAAVDREKAASMYVDAQNLAMKDAPLIALFDTQQTVVLRKDFKGYRDNPAYTYVVFFYDCYRQ